MTLWNVEFTDQFEEWWETLSGDAQRALTAAVQLLERDGPALGRPLADTIKGSRHRNMKELRPRQPRCGCSSPSTLGGPPSS